MSCYPTVPVKQIVADLAADSLSGKGPAALLWNNSEWDEEHGGVDTVTFFNQDDCGFANPASRRLLDMLEGYTKVMNGAETFVDHPDTDSSQEDEENPDEEVEDDIVYRGEEEANDKTEIASSSKGDMDLLEDDVAGVTFQDEVLEDTRVEEDDSDNHSNPGFEDVDTETTEVEEITRGVPGFSWLKAMEMWARLN
jgi:hypothetical protein